MKIAINMDRLLDIVNECFDATTDYYWSSKKYYRKHGYGVWLDHAKTDEEKHIVYAYHNDASANDTLRSLEEVFRMDGDEVNRLYHAARVAKKWYERTSYERVIPEEVLGRLESYVFNG